MSWKICTSTISSPWRGYVFSGWFLWAGVNEEVRLILLSQSKQKTKKNPDELGLMIHEISRKNRQWVLQWDNKIGL